MMPTKFDYKTIFFSDDSDYDDVDFDHYDKRQAMIPITNTTAFASGSVNTFTKVSTKVFDIDYEMSQAYKKNESKILNESIRPIAPGIYANYNSLNIVVGAQGKGKSHVVLRDIIQISRLKDHNFHLIVYISKNGNINDSTFEAQRELINLPIKVVSDSNAEDYLKELDLWKQLYARYTDEVSAEKLQQMFKFLNISHCVLEPCEISPSSTTTTLVEPSQMANVVKPLNTIILCEDFIKSKLLKSAYFTNYITQLRHKHAIVYINVQFFKAIPTDYKNNCTSFFIFNGFSKQKMHYIYQQVVMPLEFDDLWRQYRSMKNHDFVLVNTRENNIEFARFNK